MSPQDSHDERGGNNRIQFTARAKQEQQDGDVGRFEQADRSQQGRRDGPQGLVGAKRNHDEMSGEHRAEKQVPRKEKNAKQKGSQQAYPQPSEQDKLLRGDAQESRVRGGIETQMDAAGEPVAVQKPSGGTNAHANVPSFLVKTYEIVCDPESDDIICWNEEGNGFVVKRVNDFSDQVLPKYFKHNNFSSFIRQLNMYDFHKTRNMSNQQCFQHSSFRRGNKDFLRNIKRKTSAAEKQRVLVDQILGGSICTMTGPISKRRVRKAMAKLTGPPELPSGPGPLMLTHSAQRMPGGGPAPLMITQGYDEDRGEGRGPSLHQDGAAHPNGQDHLGQYGDEDGYGGALQILDNAQRGYDPENAEDELGRPGLSSDYRMRPATRRDENFRGGTQADHDLMQRSDPQAGQMISNQHFQRLVQGHSRRIDQLEQRLNHIEMLNKKYLQENFELTRENSELAKSKESHRMLERFFLMFMNSMSQGNLAGNFGQKFSLMPSTMSNRELEPPQPSPIYVEENVHDDADRALVNQSSLDRLPQITEIVPNSSSRITTERTQNQYQEGTEGHGAEEKQRTAEDQDANQAAEEKDQAQGATYTKKDSQDTKEQNQKEQPRGRQLNNEESGVSARSRRSATSRRSKSEPRNYRRENSANEDIKNCERREDDARFAGAPRLQSNQSSSKDKLIIRRNNGDNTSISKVDELNHSEYLMRNGTPIHQAGGRHDNDNLLDEIMSTGRHASNHLNPQRFYAQPRRMYSSRNELFPHPSVPSHSTPQGHQVQDVLRMMFELMSQPQMSSPRYGAAFSSNNITPRGASPRAGMGSGGFSQGHGRGSLGLSKNLGYGGQQLGQADEFKMSQMLEWLQDQMQNWMRGTRKKKQYITINEGQFFDPDRFSTSFPKPSEKAPRLSSNGFEDQDRPRQAEFEEPVGVPLQRSPRKQLRQQSVNNIAASFYDHPYDNMSQNNQQLNTSMSMKNEFSSVTEILNREEKVNQQQENRFTKQTSQIGLSHQKQKSLMHHKHGEENDAAAPQHLLQQQQSLQKVKRHFEDLSSVQPSPRVGVPGQQFSTGPYLNLEEFPSGAGANGNSKPRGNLKEVLDNLGLKSSKQNEENNLHVTKNDCSIASSLPDLLDATQILRKETNNFRLNQLDSSQAAIGPYLQDSQHKFRMPESHPANTLLQMSPRSSHNNGYQSSSKKYATVEQASMDPYAGPRLSSGQHFKRHLQQQESGTTPFSSQRQAQALPHHNRQSSLLGNQVIVESPRDALHSNFSAAQSQQLNRFISDLARDPQEGRKGGNDGNIKMDGNADKGGGVEDATGMRTQRQGQNTRERMLPGGQHQQAGQELQRPQAFPRTVGHPSDRSENSESMTKREHQSRILRDAEREAHRKQNQNEFNFAEFDQYRQYANQGQRKGLEFTNGQRDYPVLGGYNEGPAFHKDAGSTMQMAQAFHRFMSQQPMIAKGYESQSKYTDNHNVEFETISSHSNTNTAKMFNRSRQQIMMQPRAENHDAGMAAPLSYANARSYLQTSNLNSSLHEASRLSNSQSMRVRPNAMNNQTAPHKQSSRGHSYGVEGQHQVVSYGQQHDRRLEDGLYGRRDGQQSQNEESWMRPGPQSGGTQPFKRTQRPQKFADPELNVQDLDQIMDAQNRRELMQRQEGKRGLEQAKLSKDLLPPRPPAPELVKYSSLLGYQLEGAAAGPEASSEYLGHLQKNQSLFNVSESTIPANVGREESRRESRQPGRAGIEKQHDNKIPTSSGRRNSDSSPRSMEKVD